MKMTKLRIAYHTENKPTGFITVEEGTQKKGEKFEPLRTLDFSYNNLSSEMKQLLTAYGLRALLSDRTSDAKSLGANKLDWMAEVYKDLEQEQWFKKRVATGGIDRAMIHLIVELKGCTAIEAEAALKQADKAWKTAVSEKYSEELARIRSDLAAASAVDLTDL